MGAEIDDLYLLLRAQYAPLVEGFSASAAAGEEMAAKVTASVTEINASVEEMSTVVRTSMGVVDESVMAAGIEFNRLQQQTMAAVAKMDAECNKAVASFERLDKAMAASPARTGPTAKSFLLVAGATVAIGLEAAHMAGDFESATTRLVTSAGEIRSNLNLVRQGILDMAGQVGDSADDLAKALYVVESGGQHGAAGLIVLRAAAEGAKAENADLTVVADAVTSVLQDYHLKAEDAARVTSMLVAGVGAGKTNFQELAGSLHSILPLASSLHVSLQDIVGALASMTVHGMSADQAAQNLNDTLRHLAAPTQVQAKELNQLGLSAGDLKDLLDKRGLTGTLQYLSEVIMQHMGPSGRVLLNAFNQSKDAARDANIMIQSMPKNLQALALQFKNNQITAGAWTQDLKALPPVQANLLQQWATLEKRATGFNDVLKSGSPAAQTYQDALRRVTGDATGLNTTLMLTGENTAYVNNAVKTVAGATTEAGNHVRGWSEIQGTFNQKLAEAKSGLNAVAIQVGMQLLPPLSKLLGYLASGAEWLAKHKTLATVLAVALGALAVGMTVAAAATWLMNTALLANPITWIVVAIIGLIVIIYELVKHWGIVWKWIKRIAADFWQWILDAIRFFVDLWKAEWHFAVTLVKDYLDYLLAIWRGGWNLFMDYIRTMVGVWKWGWNTVKSVALDVWNFIMGIFHGIENGINRVTGAFGGLGHSLFGLAGLIPKFDEGGWVPGAPGQPRLILAHGGEFVLSRDMLSNGIGVRNTGPALGTAAMGAGSAAPPVVHLETHVYIDGQELQRVNIRQSQRYKTRNGHTGLT